MLMLNVELQLAVYRAAFFRFTYRITYEKVPGIDRLDGWYRSRVGNLFKILSEACIEHSHNATHTPILSGKL